MTHVFLIRLIYLCLGFILYPYPAQYVNCIIDTKVCFLYLIPFFLLQFLSLSLFIFYYIIVFF